MIIGKETVLWVKAIDAPNAEKSGEDPAATAASKSRKRPRPKNRCKHFVESSNRDPLPFFHWLCGFLALTLGQFHAALSTNLAIAACYINNMRLATAFITGHHLGPPQQTRNQTQKLQGDIQIPKKDHMPLKLDHPCSI